jgi:hypothetical protein
MRRRAFKYVSVFIIVLSVIIIAGCGKKTEAVITTDSEDQTEAQKEYETLAVSTAKKFSYNDLTVNSLKYLMTEQQVKSVMGEPVTVYDSSEKNVSESVLAERVYSYNDLTLIFSKIDDSYLLTAAASVSDKDAFARGIKVGDNIDKILSVYYRDTDCMNRMYYSDDKTAALGKFLYGNFTMDSLETVKTSDKVEYGLINFNGYSSMESAESYIVEMTYFEPPYKNSIASVDDDFAQIAFDVDNNGIITAIRWYYYPQAG